MIRRSILSLVILALAVPFVAKAQTTINFADYPNQSLSSLDGVSFSLSGGELGSGTPIVNVFGNPSGLSNSATGEYLTSEDLTFTFSSPASGISFLFDNQGDSESGRGASTYTAFDGATEVDSGFLGFTNLGTVDVTGSGITSLVFDNGTGGTDNWLFGVDSITFNAAATPEPASIVSLGTGLLGVAGSLYRRRRTAK